MSIIPTIVPSSSWNTLLILILTDIFLTFVRVKHVQGNRYRNVMQLEKKYGFSDAYLSYRDMTVEEAQEIYYNLATKDMPFLFEFGWIINFFKSATAPILSKLIVKTGHFTSNDRLLSHARQQDTVCLMTAMQAMPFHTMRHSLVMARINAHHNLWGPQINSDTVLWLSCMWMQGPQRWINQFGWRKVEQFEKWALFIMWRELSVMMGCKWVPHELAVLEDFDKKFACLEQRPDPVNVIFSDSMLNAITFSVPWFLKPFARKCVIAILDEDVRRCNLYEREYSPVLRTTLFGLLKMWSFVQKYFCMPRKHPRVLTPSTPNPDGTWNFPGYTFPATPFYVKKTVWNQWGPLALINRLLGSPIPHPKYGSDGVRLQSMGAKRPFAYMWTKVETIVQKQARDIRNSSWGYRPKINFQAEAIVKDFFGSGYGSKENTY